MKFRGRTQRPLFRSVEQVRRFCAGNSDHPVVPALLFLLRDYDVGIRLPFQTFNDRLRMECDRLSHQIGAWNLAAAKNRKPYHEDRQVCLPPAGQS